MRRRKLLAALLVAAVLVVVGLALAFVALRGSGRPQRAGTAVLPGLSAPVTVRFDAWGVPHVAAASGRDAAAALGYLHANDRLTQLELGRRAASGRLAEVVGEAALELDRRALTLGLRRAAETWWQGAGAETREWLQAYAAGVNAWLEARRGDLPPGLRLLRLTPEPWRPVDSLCFGLLMARDLSFWNGRPEEERFGWLRAFGPERTLELIGDGAVHAPEAILALARETAPPAAAPAAGGGAGEGAGGSNNWALGSSRTADGAPLLASDPHLPLRLPAVWYQAHLRSPDYEVAGMTLPGLPGVIIGRSRHLAWALTNLMLDDHDLFFEQLDAEGLRVRRGAGWEGLIIDTVFIRLRGGREVAHELRWSERGPLLAAEPERGLPTRSLAWTAYLPGDPLTAFLRLARSSGVEAVPEAVAAYVVPGQNLVVADDRGGLLYLMLGRAPDRRRGDGRLPSPGWDPDYGWDGLAAADGQPLLLAPADDLLVTANNDTRPPGFAAPFSADFDGPHRAARIRELLLSRGGWQPEEQAAVQVDVVSPYARRVVALADGGYGGEAAAAYAELASWDGAMGRRGPAALFALFERALREGIFGDEAEAHGLAPFDSRERLVAVLDGTAGPHWFDDVSTPAVEGRAEVVAAALARAWSEGRARWGEEIADWDYGGLHPLALRHPLGRLPLLGRWYDRGPFPVPGSATTVAAFGGPWREDRLPVAYGPSMRWVTDLGTPDRSLAVLPGGQSGHPWDPHYADQLALYLDGRLRPAPWSEAAVAAATTSTLILEPVPVP